jgi:hypothetical protein
LKTLKAYETKRYQYGTTLSFNEALIYYLSNGEPGKIAGIRNTGIKDLHKYYLLKRVNDLNSLIDYIAYLKYMKKLEEKNAGKT